MMSVYVLFLFGVLQTNSFLVLVKIKRYFGARLANLEVYQLQMNGEKYFASVEMGREYHLRPNLLHVTF